MAIKKPLVLTNGKVRQIQTPDTIYDPAWVDINRCGFLDIARLNTTIAFDGTDLFTLGTVAATWEYYRAGVRYTITGSKTKTVAAPMVDGKLYYIYIDSTDGELLSSTSAWDLIDEKIPVATLYWDSTQTPKYFLADERHTCLIDRRNHHTEHFTTGTVMKTVGALTGMTVGSDVNANKTFKIADSTLIDEDLIEAIAELAQPNGTDANYLCLYRTAASTWKWKMSNMPFVYNVGNTNNWIQYDNAGTMTDLTGGSGGNKRFVNTFLCFSNIGGVARHFIIPGRNVYTTLNDAQTSMPDLYTFNGFICSEFNIAYRLTWSTETATSQGQCTLAATPTRINVPAIFTSASAISILHNSLSGLQGGDGLNQFYHLNSADHTALTGGGSVKGLTADRVTLGATATTLKDSANLTFDGTNALSIGGLPALRVVAASSIFYIATTGSDTTGDGSSGTPWLTLGKALSYLADKWLAGTVTIQFGDGTHTQAAVTVNHPQGVLLTIKGTNTYAKTMSSVQSSSGGSAAWSVIINLNNVTNIAANDYVLISAASGGTLPTYICGCHKVTNVDSGNSRITITSKHLNATPPSGAVAATVIVVKTILNINGNAGITVTSKLGSIASLVIAGGGGGWASTSSYCLVSSGSISLGLYLGLAGAAYALLTFDGNFLGFSVVYMSDFAIGAQSSYGNTIICQYAIATGCTHAGFSAWGGTVDAYGAIATGNGNGFYAVDNGTMRAGAATSTGNTTAYSPLVNTEGNNYAVIAQ